MNKARDIWRGVWREHREPLLAGLDIEYMQALEADDKVKQAEVAAKKQELKDVTNTNIDDVDTPDDLMLVWPDILGDAPPENFSPSVVVPDTGAIW